MSRKLPRLLFVASLVAGASLAPMLGAYAQDERGIDIRGTTYGVNGKADAYPGDMVVWVVRDDGEHTITPEEPERWDGNHGSGTLNKDDEFRFRFDRPGTYAYYCTIHGRDTMSGEVNVIDPNPPAPPPPPPPPPPSNNTPPPPAPPPTTTTRPVVTTTSPPATSAGSKTPTSAAPAPTTTTKGKDKDRKPKEEETTTTTAPPPPPAPIDLPDEAIVPSLPGFGPTGTTIQDGIEAPEGTPEGDAVALLRSGKGEGGNAKKLLIVSGLGLGVLGLGTGGYKYANRSSKYFPA